MVVTTVNNEVILISSPAIVNSVLFRCYFSVNSNIASYLLNQSYEQQLDYFTLLTFTDDLVMTYIKHVWECPRLIVLKLLLYLLWRTVFPDLK